MPDTLLANALKQAKTKPMSFAFVAKGAEGKLLVNKIKIPPKDTADAKKSLGGGTIFKGRCLFENDVMVFEVAKEPPGTLANLIKKLIKNDAALTMNVLVRVNPELAEGDETEGGEPPAVPEAPAAPVQPDAAAAEARYKDRLKALLPAVQKVAASHPQVAVQAKQAIGLGNNLVLAKNFAQANAQLDKVETLIKGASAASSAAPTPAAPPVPPAAPAPTAAPTPAAPPAPGAVPQHDEAARFSARLKALAPKMLDAAATNSPLAAQAKHKAAEAGNFFKAKDYQQANAALDQAEALIQQALAAPAKDQQPPAAGTDVAGVWIKASDLVIGQITQLQDVLRKSQDPDLLAIANQGVSGLIKDLQAGLRVGLTRFDQAQGDAKEKAKDKAESLVEDWQDTLASDRRIAMLDENPFGVKVSVKQTLDAALKDIVQQLNA